MLYIPTCSFHCVLPGHLVPSYPLLYCLALHAFVRHSVSALSPSTYLSLLFPFPLPPDHLR